MRRLLLFAVLAAVCATPAAAQHLLFTTAATPARIDVFRVSASGLPTGEPPVVQQQLAGERPRRVIVNEARCALYVAETDRVEVYKIHKNGKLDRIGGTKRTKKMQAHDIELSVDGNMLYVPLRQQNTIAAYPLDAEGKPSNDPVQEGNIMVGQPTSCIWGEAGASWEDIEIQGDKLYATATNRLNVYGIDANGQLLGAARVPKDLNGDGTITEDERDVYPPKDKDHPTAGDGMITSGDLDLWGCAPYSITPNPIASIDNICVDPELKTKPKDLPVKTCPFTFRGRINGATGLIVRGTTLVVGERFIKDLLGFMLQADGNFQPIPPDAQPISPDPPGPDLSQYPTKKEKTKERKSRKKNRTEEQIRYVGLTYFDGAGDRAPVIYGAGYKGRVDAFRLNPNPNDPTILVPKEKTSATPKNVVSTPTRTFVGLLGNSPTLYVAAGELDRIEAFKIADQGALDDKADPVMTPVLKDSFPNDVVLVDTSACD
jgi:6-phosphogluconolactonase (cycloisomerase 2 family)